MANVQSMLEKRLEKALKGLPAVVGAEAVNFSLDRFSQQNWLDTGAEAWPPRKAGKQRRANNRALLVKAGRLRRGNRIIETGPLRVVLGNDVPYAKAHNDGFFATVTIPAHSRNKFSSSKTGTGKFTRSGKERMKTVKSISGSIQVKAHQRRMNIPRRRFMGKSRYLSLRLAIVGRNHIIQNF